MSKFQSNGRRFEEVAVNESAEKGLVSHMLQRASDIDMITTICRADDIHDPSLRRLFELLVQMFQSGDLHGSKLDDGIIATRMASYGMGKEFGSLVYELLQIPPVHARQHALEVQKRSSIRKLLQSLEATQDAILCGVDYQEAVGDFTATIDAIQARQADDTKSVHELMLEELQNLQTWRQPDVMSGLPKVDDVFGGFLGGELVTVCAPTSGGKSAFALQVSQHNGMRGRPVLYVTLEMRENEKIRRLWRQGVGLAGVKFGRQELTAEQVKSAKDETNRNANNGLHVCYMATPTWRDVETKIRAFRANHGLSMFVVDYVGLVHKSDPRQTVHEKTSEITSGMKRLAGQLNCVALAVVQVNREGMKSKAVELHNLADCSSVERDSDIVLGINQPNDVDNGEREIAVLKNRSGEKFRLKGFEFDGSRMIFSERMFYEFG